MRYKDLSIFIIEIKITQAKNNYKKDQTILVPVESISSYNAEIKFLNNYYGPEYPLYKIIKIHKYDNVLFTPFKTKPQKTEKFSHVKKEDIIWYIDGLDVNLTNILYASKIITDETKVSDLEGINLNGLKKIYGIGPASIEKLRQIFINANITFLDKKYL